MHNKKMIIAVTALAAACSGLSFAPYKQIRHAIIFTHYTVRNKNRVPIKAPHAYLVQ